MLTTKMDDEGYDGSFQNGKWKFYKGSFIGALAQKQGTLYVMHAKWCKDEENVAGDSSGEVWQKKLGPTSKEACIFWLTRNSSQK